MLTYSFRFLKPEKFMNILLFTTARFYIYNTQ